MKFWSLLVFVAITIACQPKEDKNGIIQDGDATTGGASGGSSGGSGSSANFGIIFVSSKGFNGGGGSVSSGTPAPGSGISMFDDVCAQDATDKNLSGTFKALVTDGSSRRACSTSNCSGGAGERLDWPLATRMEYRREDKTTIIGKTDKTGRLNFPLTNAFSATAETIWTGIGSGWLADQHCLGWTSDAFGNSARTGLANSTGSAAINGGPTANCSMNDYKFLCVQVKSDVAATPQPAYRRIFATASTYNMNAPVASDGLTRLDGFCRTEATALGYSTDDDTFKALVMTNGSGGTYTKRIACLSAFCSAGTSEQQNWVLDSNREYRRQDGTTVIGTTNADGIFVPPLTNSLTGVNETFWTGFPDSWAILNFGSNSDCGSWTNPSAGGQVYFGTGDATDATAFSNTLGNMGNCSASRKILCVEQTR